MKHIEAVSTIKGLWPKDTYLKFWTQHGTRVGETGNTDFENTVYVIVPMPNIFDKKCISFTSNTWQGVIDKMKIHLLPKGEPDIFETIEEEIDHTTEM